MGGARGRGLRLGMSEHSGPALSRTCHSVSASVLKPVPSARLVGHIPSFTLPPHLLVGNGMVPVVVASRRW
jgi:hypothetical protein